MPFYLAIDGGGTKTQCLLADSERILARASTGTVKLMRVSEQEATSRLQAMLAQVAAASGVSLSQVTRTCFGLAGVSDPVVQTWAVQSVAAGVSGELLLCGDEEIALDSAFRGGLGILIIAGTGSNAVGRSANGHIFGAGGWGPVLGDEGSGYWIGLEAIRVALRAQDGFGTGAASTGLLREIERHWGLGSVAELVAMANQRPGPDFASLAPVVAGCAEQGDALAARILERAGEELADLVALVFYKMTGSSSQEGHPESAPAGLTEVGVAFTGSVLSRIAPVRGTLEARLAILVPRARVFESPVDSLEGALWRARET